MQKLSFAQGIFCFVVLGKIIFSHFLWLSMTHAQIPWLSITHTHIPWLSRLLENGIVKFHDLQVFRDLMNHTCVGRITEHVRRCVTAQVDTVMGMVTNPIPSMSWPMHQIKIFKKKKKKKKKKTTNTLTTNTRVHGIRPTHWPTNYSYQSVDR